MLRPLGFTLLKLCRSANIICEQIRISRAACCRTLLGQIYEGPSSLHLPTPSRCNIVHVAKPSFHSAGRSSVNRGATLSFPPFLSSSIFFASIVEPRPPAIALEIIRAIFLRHPTERGRRGREKNIGFIFKARNFIYVYLLETWRISEENVV